MMKVVMAYIFVVIIWSTTPLAIQWSNSSFSFLAAVTVRMVFALLLCIIVLSLLRGRFKCSAEEWKVMFAGGISFFPNMILVYWSAQFIPSGLISVLLGIYPFLVGLLSILILKENPFDRARILALSIAVMGLVIIHVEQINIGREAFYGVLGILASALLFALSTVWLKKVGGGVEPIRQLTGSLLFAAPLFVLTWWIFDGEMPKVLGVKSIAGVAYLVVAGTVMGGVAFYYVLARCQVGTVSLIPLMTPVFAMLLGYLLEGERLSIYAIVGSGFILVSLGVYQGGGGALLRLAYTFRTFVRIKVRARLLALGLI